MGLLASDQMGAMPALFVRNEYIDFRMIKLRHVGTLWFGITNEMVYDSLSVWTGCDSGSWCSALPCNYLAWVSCLGSITPLPPPSPFNDLRGWLRGRYGDWAGGFLPGTPTRVSTWTALYVWVSYHGSSITPCSPHLAILHGAAAVTNFVWSVPIPLTQLITSISVWWGSSGRGSHNSQVCAGKLCVCSCGRLTGQLYQSSRGASGTQLSASCDNFHNLRVWEHGDAKYDEGEADQCIFWEGYLLTPIGCVARLQGSQEYCVCGTTQHQGKVRCKT